MKDLTKTMDITMREEEEEAAAGTSTPQPADGDKAEASADAEPGAAAAATSSEASASASVPPPVYTPYVPGQATLDPHGADTPGVSPSPTPSGRSTPRPNMALPTRLAIEPGAGGAETLTPSEQAQMTDEERRLREKQKRKGALSREQREALAAFELERKRQREERVSALAAKLVARLNVWTETDRGADVTAAFRAQARLEMENLKMESFGLEILHAIGATYLAKATGFLKSQKLFGLSGLWSKMKEKGTLAKETWTTISTAIDAQVTMEEMVRLEEKGGEDWTDERKAEYEKRVTGKILAAAWRGSKFEIQSVLREVCERVLYDKSVRPEKRFQRAEGLVIIGELFAKVRLSAAFGCDRPLTRAGGAGPRRGGRVHGL
jgi:hypothetical protein